MYQLTSVPVLSEVVVTYLSTIIVSIPNDNCLVMPELRSVDDMYRGHTRLLQPRFSLMMDHIGPKNVREYNNI